MIRQFDIEFVKLKNGEHKYTFTIDDSFFSEKEGSLYDRGEGDVLLTFRKSENLFDLSFNLKGYVWTECDRCLDPIQVAFEAKPSLRIKINAEKAGEEEFDLWYLHPNDHKFNIYDLLYDSICTSLPFKKVCAEALHPKECNPAVTDKLNETEQKEKNNDDPRWSELNKLLNN